MAKVLCQNCNQEFETGSFNAKWCLTCRPIVHRVVEQKYEQRHPNFCVDCGKRVIRRAERCRICENKNRIGKHLGENNPNWKGGRVRQSDGYVYVLGKRPNRKHRYQLEHIIVWEEANGELPQGWIIHHLNGIKDDNRLENLVALPRKRHSPTSIIEPHQERIRQLEAELRRLNELPKGDLEKETWGNP